MAGRPLEESAIAQPSGFNYVKPAYSSSYIDAPPLRGLVVHLETDFY